MKALVAIDLHTANEAVLEAVCRVVRGSHPGQEGAELLVLHMTDPHAGFVGYASDVPLSRDQLADKYREEHHAVQEFSSKLREQGFEACGMLVEGEPVKGVLAEAAKHEVDLIVVASHGHGAMYDFLVGSESRGILKESTVPVLVVPIRT